MGIHNRKQQEWRRPVAQHWINLGIAALAAACYRRTAADQHRITAESAIVIRFPVAARDARSEAAQLASRAAERAVQLPVLHSFGKLAACMRACPRCRHAVTSLDRVRLGTCVPLLMCLRA